MTSRQSCDRHQVACCHRVAVIAAIARAERATVRLRAHFGGLQLGLRRAGRQEAEVVEHDDSIPSEIPLHKHATPESKATTDGAETPPPPASSRIDLHLEVPAVAYQTLEERGGAEPSEAILSGLTRSERRADGSNAPLGLVVQQLESVGHPDLLPVRGGKRLGHRRCGEAVLETRRVLCAVRQTVRKTAHLNTGQGAFML
jgi:hypothetical protein